ncbi:50S ribosomal protein L25 [Candidatus Curtissbacteria bacterium]|nr:50S ribosomal protein L25 [Candidatus Curtissbacteria bacterium]
MQQIPLDGQKREVLGRKVKQIRKEGLIPAHIFGHKIETIHAQVNGHDFRKVYEKAGETGVIELKIDGKSHPVLVRSLQIHPLTDEIQHIDFYQVNLLEKVKVNVPLEIVGEAPAVEKKIGLLLTPVTEVEVEALPTDLPESIQVDISNLAAIDDAIKVANLQIDRSKVEVLADAELVVAQIGELVTKEMEAVEAEAEAAAEAAEATEGAEGEEAKEGEEAEGEEGEKETDKEGTGETKEPESKGEEKKD